MSGLAPLAGTRVLDFSRQFAGGLGTRYLATLGAEVLRVEWPEPPGLDFIRFFGSADGIDGLNRGGMFNGANVEKRSFTLNMGTEKGRSLARDLVRLCDVVYENMTPRVMQGWGLDYASMKEIREDIIYVSCSGFGHDGPAAGYRSYGSPSQGHTGLLTLAGLPGRPPAGWAFQIGDTHAATQNALTVLTALLYRRRTGRGVFVDAAQTQGNVTLLGQYLLELAANGPRDGGDPEAAGNRRAHPRAAPHNAYRCIGPDRWCVIAVFDDDQWGALRRALGDPRWARAPELATSEGRYASQDVIDAELSAWTSKRDRYHVARLLQEHGVPAGVVQDTRDVLDWDIQLAHRGTFAVYEHDEAGRRRHETVGARLSKMPYVPNKAAPLLGEANDYVFRDLLGLSDAELAALEADDVVRSL
ncbi:MAG: CoA transferase [Acidimicrobiales bacterium]|nr:CoA transferase [Acidimicrobiales bacterium]